MGMPRAPPSWTSRALGRVPMVVPLTPLNAKPSEILTYDEECQVVKILETYPRDFPGQDLEKFNRLHLRYEHNTDECQAWRKEIEALIQSGQLGNFIDWNRMHLGNVWRKETTDGSGNPTPSKYKPKKTSIRVSAR